MHTSRPHLADAVNVLEAVSAGARDLTAVLAGPAVFALALARGNLGQERHDII